LVEMALLRHDERSLSLARSLYDLV
jgi:hypothetical protein